MMKHIKKSRCGFVVIKFNIDAEDYFVMRQNPNWKDMNFVGGHEIPRDGGSLERAARRELIEEVPALRAFKCFELAPLTNDISYGPIFSRSAGCQAEYLLQFFLLRFSDTPKPLFEALRTRTLNTLVSQRDLLAQRKYRISGLVNVLNDTLPGGLRSIPYSWPEDVGGTLRDAGLLWQHQQELALKSSRLG